MGRRSTWAPAALSGRRARQAGLAGDRDRHRREGSPPCARTHSRQAASRCASSTATSPRCERPVSGDGFRLLLDTGTFHGLSDAQRIAMGREVSAVAAPAATLILDCFAPRRRGPLPRGASRDDIERAFPDWEITDVDAADTIPIRSRGSSGSRSASTGRGGATMVRLEREHQFGVPLEPASRSSPIRQLASVPGPASSGSRRTRVSERPRRRDPPGHPPARPTSRAPDDAAPFRDEPARGVPEHAARVA